MALTITIDRKVQHAAGIWECWGRFTPDSSWLAAGEVVDVDGLTRIDDMTPVVKGGYVFTLNPATQTVLGFYGDNNNASDGPLIAIPDAVDLTTPVGSAPVHFYGS